MVMFVLQEVKAMSSMQGCIEITMLKKEMLGWWQKACDLTNGEEKFSGTFVDEIDNEENEMEAMDEEDIRFETYYLS